MQEKPDTSETLKGLSLSGTLFDTDKARFLLPLFHHEYLMGIVLLTEPRASRTLDQEDRDLLKMVSRQAAGYLSEQRSARALAEARLEGLRQQH